MTRKIGDLYQCEECKLLFRDELWAERCEIWCRENKSCNIEITQHAVDNPGLKL